MLIYFKVENYKSFKEETVIDMRATTSISDLKHTIMKVANDKLLRVATIYGSNGSGKSNFINAFESLLDVITNLNLDNVNTTENISFSFDEGEIKPTKFEINFVVDGLEYMYSCAVLNKKFVYENVYRVKKNNVITIFERDIVNNYLVLSDELLEYRDTLNKLSGEKSLLNFLYENYDVTDIVNMMSWFLGISSYNKILRTTDNNKDNTKEYIYSLCSNNIQSKMLSDFMQQFEPSIKRVEYDLNNRGDVNKLWIVREFNNHEYSTSFEQESDGHQKLVLLFCIIKNSIEGKVPLVIDDLDKHLHPVLLKLILMYFHDETKNPFTQLIMTLHDTSILNNILLRRDEVWFVEKDENLVSQVYSLYNIKDEYGNRIRKDASYGKDYLNGYYGAAPDNETINI